MIFLKYGNLKTRTSRKSYRMTKFKLTEILIFVGLISVVPLGLKLAYGYTGYNKDASDLIQTEIKNKALMERFQSIIETCSTKIQSGDDSLIIPCNKVISNVDNHTRKAFNETATEINTILFKQ